MAKGWILIDPMQDRVDYPLVAFSTKEGERKLNPAAQGNEDNR